jgi:hypothetical protein
MLTQAKPCTSVLTAIAGLARLADQFNGDDTSNFDHRFLRPNKGIALHVIVQERTAVSFGWTGQAYTCVHQGPPQVVGMVPQAAPPRTTSEGHGGRKICPQEEGGSIPPGDTNPALFGTTLISLLVVVPDLAGLYPVCDVMVLR